MTKIQRSNHIFHIQFYQTGNKNMLQQKALELYISQNISQQNLVFLLFNAGSLLSFNCVLLSFIHFINTSRAISLTALI